MALGGELLIEGSHALTPCHTLLLDSRALPQDTDQPPTPIELPGSMQQFTMLIR